MPGTHPYSALAPLDYRYALDAAMPLLAAEGPPLVRCHVPVLMDEVHQRIPDPAHAQAAAAALWVEPLQDSWQNDLYYLAHALPGGASLVIVASRPLARMLPERRTWPGQPLGMQMNGIGILRQGLRHAGFVVQSVYGIHSLLSIGLNLLSQQVARFRPELGDRLHFAARLRYCTGGPLAALSTVALLFARSKKLEHIHVH